MGRARVYGVGIRLDAIGLGAVVLALGTAGLVAWLLSAPPAPPHIILISVDTLRADRLGAYGYEVPTPNLDVLAKQGTLFVNATVPFPRTTPAMASLFTGLRPEHHGSREVQQPVKRGRRLAEILKASGYQTIGVTANPACGQAVGLARGFDIFSEQITSAKVNEEVIKALGRIDRNRPVLVWAHYLDPHWPYQPRHWWLRQRPTGLCRKLWRFPAGIVFGNTRGLAQAALADCSLHYDGEVAAVDARVGNLLSSLSEVLGENRIVLFTSDHGENLGEDGLFYEHGPSVHGASLEVPLIIAGTGIEAGAIDRELIRIEDLMPTLLRIAKIDRQHWPTMDGVDMSARLRGALFSRRSSDRARSIVTLAESGSALQARFFNRVVSGARGGLACTNGPRFSLCRQPDGPAELYDHIADPFLTTDLSAKHPDRIAVLEEISALWPVERARQRAIRTTRFKLVARPRWEGGYALSLYDLESDPRETRDARSEYPEIFRQLKERLDTWSASLPDLDVPQRSAAEMEALRALGYVEGSK